MTEPFDNHTEEKLRAVLRAEADSVDPSPEALNLIRARTEKKHLVYSWLRPILAVGAAAAIAGSVLVGTPQVREQVLPEFFPAAGTEQSPPSGQDRGDRPAESPAPSVSGSDEVENPANDREPATTPYGNEDGTEPPEESGMTMTCPTTPGRPDAPTTANEDDEAEVPDDDCTPSPDPSEDDSGGGDDGSGDSGGDDGSGDSGGDDGSGDSGGDDGSGDSTDSPGGGDNGSGDDSPE
ncbi:hypothetical protein [Allosalinactinospora lopnorensis]|uniref:hypothetical protein n=1 Tax=Allosalinactinospora lopnorensis TaxID=1352348 RepID=UPI000623D2CD|nr:hypothetical protein [Allosalinactinospora lopnorensis]